MDQWANLAAQLADDAREPGFGAAAVFAAAAAARVDPGALQGLVAAALALTEGEALHALWGPVPPCPDAVMLVSWEENLEAHVADLLKRCEHLGRACRDEHDAAAEARALAARAARTAETAARIPGQRQAAEATLETARARMQDAGRVAADCEAALETLGGLDRRLRYARDQLRALPGQLGEVYEAPARLAAAGGVMPHSGDFIVPAEPAGTTAAA